MGLRFQRRVRLLPGVTLNFSKSGISTSFGTRGLRFTIGHGKRRFTVGVPGSGLSYTTVHSARIRRAKPSVARPGDVDSPAVRNFSAWLWLVVGVAALLAVFRYPGVFFGAAGILVLGVIGYMVAHMERPSACVTCPYCGQEIEPSTACECTECKQRITWISGRAYKPSRPAD